SSKKRTGTEAGATKEEQDPPSSPSPCERTPTGGALAGPCITCSKTLLSVLSPARAGRACKNPAPQYAAGPSSNPPGKFHKSLLAVPLLTGGADCPTMAGGGRRRLLCESQNGFCTRPGRIIGLSKASGPAKGGIGNRDRVPSPGGATRPRAGRAGEARSLGAAAAGAALMARRGCADLPGRVRHRDRRRAREFPRRRA